jgi:hypothetical protein
VSSDKALDVAQKHAALVTQMGQGNFPNTDGNTYGNGPIRQHIAVANHNQAVTSTTPANVPDLQGLTVTTGTYRITGLFTLTQGAGTGSMNFRITGPACGDCETLMKFRQAGTTTYVGVYSQGAQSGSGSGYNSGAMSSYTQTGAGAVVIAEMDCSIAFTAAGPLGLQVAQGTGGLWTLDYGWWELSPG